MEGRRVKELMSLKGWTNIGVVRTEEMDGLMLEIIRNVREYKYFSALFQSWRIPKKKKRSKYFQTV